MPLQPMKSTPGTIAVSGADDFKTSSNRKVFESVCVRNHFFQRRILTEYAGNVYWKLPESTVMTLDFGAMFSGVS